MGIKNQENLTNLGKKSLMREAQALTKIKMEKTCTKKPKRLSQHNPYFAPQAHRIRFIHASINIYRALTLCGFIIRFGS